MAKIVIEPDLCKSCKLCIGACPKGIIKIGDKINNVGDYYAVQISEEMCTGCALCAIMCGDSAITVYR